MPRPFLITRRAMLLMALLVLALPALAPSARAATPAENFITDNIHKGLTLLNDKKLSTAQRRDQFAAFLLGITDMKRIADFTLGQYRRGASPADLAEFENAFQEYALAVYQSYFAKYAGQTLVVKGSSVNAPNDYIVATNLIDPNNQTGQAPLEVDFRVRTDGPKPVVTDFSVAGIWISLEERDTFSAFLGQNNGSIPTLVSHLRDLAKQY